LTGGKITISGITICGRGSGTDAGDDSGGVDRVDKDDSSDGRRRGSSIRLYWELFVCWVELSEGRASDS
jgi:hypothetical protein